MLAIASALVIAACAEAPEEALEAPLAMTAMQHVREAAKDPDSVKFRQVEVVSLMTPAGPAPIVCGEFNAKNAFGGYTGFEQFTWHPDGGLIIASSFPAHDKERISAGIQSFCSGTMPESSSPGIPSRAQRVG